MTAPDLGSGRLGWLGLFLILVLLAGCGGGANSGESMEMIRVQRDLLRDFDRWEIVRQTEGGAPTPATITLSREALSDSGDLPTLVMPPPCTMRYVVPEEDAPAILRAAAGADWSVPRQLKLGSPPMRLRFVAELDGETVQDLTLDLEPLARDGQVEENPPSWAWIGGKEDGVLIRGGQTLTLRTWIAGSPRMAPANMRVGYGELVTETVQRRERTTSSADRPNIVLFVMDTQRADRSSLHGYEKETTPHLERLAARGVTYDNAWSTSSWTWPSTASLLTGMGPLAHGVTGHRSCYLAHSLATLPKALQERGFSTAAFSANPLIVPDKNFDAGFERFDFVADFTPGAEIMPAALDWVRDNADRRFFLYVHLVDPHGPHRPLPEERERLGGMRRPADFPPGAYEVLTNGLRARWSASETGEVDYEGLINERQRAWIHFAYDACVASGDHWLGELLDLLDELGLEQRTVVGYTSDHGEELFDHMLTDHAHTLHPELLRVPLVIAGPGVPEGVRTDVRVSNRHLGATLAYLGAADLGVADSQDLTRPTNVEKRTLRLHTAKGMWNDRWLMPIFGYLDDDWAFHWASRAVPRNSVPRADPGLGEWKLYDRRTDPMEHRDVAGQHPELVLRFRRDLEAWNEQQSLRRPKIFAAGAETLKTLQGIGYIGAEGAPDGPRGKNGGGH